MFIKVHSQCLNMNPPWCRWLSYLPFTQDTGVRVPVAELFVSCCTKNLTGKTWPLDNECVIFSFEFCSETHISPQWSILLFNKKYFMLTKRHLSMQIALCINQWYFPHIIMMLSQRNFFGDYVPPDYQLIDHYFLFSMINGNVNS